MKKKTYALLLAVLLTMTGCGGTKTPAPAESKATEAPETEAAAANESTAEETQAPAETEAPAPEKKTRLHIDGFDADHVPHLDGSLANEPLLVRMMMELTGCDEETAEVYLADSFVNGGTSTSWGNLAYQMTDLIVSYEPPAETKAAYEPEMEDLEIDPLGCDGLVFIVNKNNPIESLTVDQIRDIYTGRVTDWSQVGGEPGEIRAFQRNSTSGSQTLLNKLVMNGETPMEPDKDLLVGTMGELIESVAAFDGSGSAIGFSVYYYADRMKTDPNLKMIRVDGIAPGNDTIESHTYPLVNDFYVAIRASEEADSPIRSLRDWLLTDEGRALMEEEGYVWARTGMEPVSRGAGNPFK